MARTKSIYKDSTPPKEEKKKAFLNALFKPDTFPGPSTGCRGFFPWANNEIPLETSDFVADDSTPSTGVTSSETSPSKTEGKGKQ